MPSLPKQFRHLENSARQGKILAQIDATNTQIDKLVHKLYELTPDKIKNVETTR